MVSIDVTQSIQVFQNPNRGDALKNDGTFDGTFSKRH